MNAEEVVAFHLLKQLCDSHLAVSQKIADAGNLALAQRDAALLDARASRLNAERAFDCHGGPGTSIPACEACVSCLMRRVDQVYLRAQERREAAVATDSIVGACDCITKTPEIQHHQPGCRYRLISERDEARQEIAALRVAFAEASHNAGPAFVAHEELKRLREEVEEEGQLREKLADILHRTGDALKGPPAPLHAHSWHDLPEVAAALRAERDAAKNEVSELFPAVAAMRAHVDATRAEALRVVSAAGQTHGQLINEQHRLGQAIDQLLQHASARDCEGAECSTCGEIVCPHGDCMHFHHDGCPSCANDEEHEEDEKEEA